jgi:hypothetical protein
MHPQHPWQAGGALGVQARRWPGRRHDPASAAAPAAQPAHLRKQRRLGRLLEHQPTRLRQPAVDGAEQTRLLRQADARGVEGAQPRGDARHEARRCHLLRLERLGVQELLDAAVGEQQQHLRRARGRGARRCSACRCVVGSSPGCAVGGAGRRRGGEWATPGPRTPQR